MNIEEQRQAIRDNDNRRRRERYAWCRSLGLDSVLSRTMQKWSRDRVERLLFDATEDERITTFTRIWARSFYHLNAAELNDRYREQSARYAASPTGKTFRSTNKTTGGEKPTPASPSSPSRAPCSGVIGQTVRHRQAAGRSRLSLMASTVWLIAVAPTPSPS